MEIRDMVRERTEDYAEIYVSVFNGAPWNESWTKEKAVRRIQDMMETNTFSGLALMDGEEVCGMIWGQKEQFYNGIHFQIQEFCIRSGCQGKGYGPRLLQAFTDRLKELGLQGYICLPVRERGQRAFTCPTDSTDPAPQ